MSLIRKNAADGLGLVFSSVASRASESKYSVYISDLRNYVERTGDIATRTAYWASQRRFVQSVVSGLTYDESRGVEQALINRFGGPGGGQLVNKINSISSKSPDYQRLVNIGEKILNNISFK